VCRLSSIEGVVDGACPVGVEGRRGFHVREGVPDKRIQIFGTHPLDDVAAASIVLGRIDALPDAVSTQRIATARAEQREQLHQIDVRVGAVPVLEGGPKEAGRRAETVC